MGSSATWTVEENKKFEKALAIFEENNPKRWENVAEAVGSKTIEDVKLHYEKLMEDLQMIEDGSIPIPDYEKAEKEEIHKGRGEDMRLLERGFIN